MPIRVPKLSYEDVRREADRFLSAQHPSVEIPVPIEEIVEFRLGLKIVPLPGLHVRYDIDGFLSGDLVEISVDLHVFESFPSRYRFTLAHEVGHVVLHGDALKAVRPASVTDWKWFVQELSERDRGWLEWQAYAFAGLVLAPRDPLTRAYRDACRFAQEQGIDPEANLDIARDYIARAIGDLFEVSATVIDKRLVKDGIWPDGRR